MGGRRDAGFNLIELAVMVVVAALAMATLFRGYHAGITGAVAGAACIKAKDIYVALAVDSAERGGAPDAWTASAEDRSCAATNLACLSTSGFPTSTAFFQCAVEGRLRGQLGYDSLVAGGVPVGRSGAFSATNNIWTIAANVPTNAPDTVPLLLSRNVDLAPLAAAPRAGLAAKALGVDSAWAAPLHDWGFVVLRKGGAVSTGRFKRATYGSLFSCGLPSNRCVRASAPLTYLTPAQAFIVGD